MATRTYTKDGREFAITLSGTPNPVGYNSWSVELVTENGDEVSIPGLDNVAASSEDTAFVQVHELIDRFVAR